ncbi:EAL domain-containing protein [Vibrio cholerae]|uniref:EAL domain-containing protein n=1 Tax=Vibrio cholerae TaxID=666 RepID=UPI00301BD90A
MQRIIRHHEFVPYTHNVMNTLIKETTGIEILMRWEHPNQGVVRPDFFIHQAEDSGLIIPMTKLLFKEVAKKLNKYKDIFLG